MSETPKLWEYRGHKLSPATVVSKLQKLSGEPMNEEHGKWIGIYLRDGPAKYRHAHRKPENTREYHQVRTLMAQFIMSLKAVRGTTDETTR